MVALPLRRGNAPPIARSVSPGVRRSNGAEGFPVPSGFDTLPVMARSRPGLRVLVVDDNHLIRRLLGLILESAGFETVEAESAEDALALAAELPPDLWIVDEVMPGLCGSDLVRRLRRSRDARLAAAPIVGLSGRAGAGAELRAAGCDVFVAKPIDEHRVLTALDRAIRGRRAGARNEVPAA